MKEIPPGLSFDKLRTGSFRKGGDRMGRSNKPVRASLCLFLWDMSHPNEKGHEGGTALSGSDSYAGEEIFAEVYSFL
jgi:hypothetical protein